MQYPESILSESFLLKKYAVLMLAIYENLCDSICPTLFNHFIEIIILPAQQSNMPIFEQLVKLFVNTLSELALIPKTWNQRTLERIDKVNKLYKYHSQALVS